MVTSSTATASLSNGREEYNYQLSQTRNRDRTQIHRWLLPLIPQPDLRLASEPEARSDRWQGDVVLETDLGWRVRGYGSSADS